MGKNIGLTCRCPICSRNDAGSNRTRKSYINAGITKDEHGFIGSATSKANSRKLRRTREKRAVTRMITAEVA